MPFPQEKFIIRVGNTLQEATLCGGYQKRNGEVWITFEVIGQEGNSLIYHKLASEFTKEYQAVPPMDMTKGRF